MVTEAINNNNNNNNNNFYECNKDNNDDDNDDYEKAIHVENQQMMDNQQRSGRYTGFIETATNKPHAMKNNNVGKMVYDNGRFVYEGQWDMGSWSGVGTLVDNTTNEIYKGEFVKNKKHGQGSITYPDGRIYNGSFCEGKMEKGTMTFPDKSTYWGCWLTKYNRPAVVKNDKRAEENNINSVVAIVVPHGRGKYTYADGSVYDGEFMDGVRFGHGRMVWPCGRWYLGDWTHGKQHGDGVEVDGNGKLIYRGKFENGEPADAKAKKKYNKENNKKNNKKKKRRNFLLVRQKSLDSSFHNDNEDTTPNKSTSPLVVYPTTSPLCRGRLIGRIPSVVEPQKKRGRSHDSFFMVCEP